VTGKDLNLTCHRSGTSAARVDVIGPAPEVPSHYANGRVEFGLVAAGGEG